MAAKVMVRENDQPVDLTDDSAVVAELAGLKGFKYKRKLAEAAKTHGISVEILDEAVRRKREDSARPGGGRPLSFQVTEPWPHEVDGSLLLDEISQLSQRFLGLPRHGETILVLWIAMTYLADILDCLPLLFITAPEKGCGKSTVLDFLTRFVPKPLPTANITAAALFRTVDRYAPTLLIDEADSFLRCNEALRGIINSGHTRSAAHVVRTDGDDHEILSFSTWGPKAIAGIGRQHGTIEDRSVILSLKRLTKDEKREKLRNRTDFAELRSKLVRWCCDNSAQIADVPLEITEGLGNRAADNWYPLFAIAEIAGGNWRQHVRTAADTFAGQYAIDSIGTELLRAVRQVFDSTKQTRLPTVTLIQRLCDDEASRWCDHNGGHAITGSQIARLLKRYEIKPKPLRIPGIKDPTKGYDSADFHEAFGRYL